MKNLLKLLKLSFGCESASEFNSHGNIYVVFHKKTENQLHHNQTQLSFQFEVDDPGRIEELSGKLLSRLEARGLGIEADFNSSGSTSSYKFILQEHMGGGQWAPMESEQGMYLADALDLVLGDLE